MRRFSATLVLCLFATPCVAAAQTHPGGAVTPSPVNDAAARGRFQAGQAFYEDGRFEEALVEFQAAWEFSGRVEMLINIANAAERALKFDVAVEHLRLYLERVPNAPDREATERRIARDEGAMTRMGQNGAAGGTTANTGTPPPTVPPAQPSPEDGGPPIAAIVTLSGGGALGIVALITGLLAHGTYSDLQTACPDGLCPADRASDLSSGKGMALASTVFTGLAIVAGGVGLVLLLLDGDDTEAPAARARLELAPGPAPLGATARVRF
jgi:tetratricopeptide (TPR) repeat protein